MSVVIKPIVSEKFVGQGEKLKCYAFAVDRRADKNTIKKEIENLYGVEVVNVNTMNYSGKTKQRYTKTGVQRGKTSSYKKAIVKLAKDDSIDFYNN